MIPTLYVLYNPLRGRMLRVGSGVLRTFQWTQEEIDVVTDILTLIVDSFMGFSLFLPLLLFSLRVFFAL